MDGWESRRKRVPGPRLVHDPAGRAGRRCSASTSTPHYFLGNHPPFASIEGLPRAARHGADGAARRASWSELLPQIAAAARLAEPVRGAVRRRRSPTCASTSSPTAAWRACASTAASRPTGSTPGARRRDARATCRPELVDLAAVENGGLALACSDAFFGPMNNLLLPGPRREHGRRLGDAAQARRPGHDWILVRLGARGTAGADRGRHQPLQGQLPRSLLARGHRRADGARITDLIASAALACRCCPRRSSRPTHRHFFSSELVAHGAFTHVRLNIFPDGGVSRLRVWGRARWLSRTRS